MMDIEQIDDDGLLPIFAHDHPEARVMRWSNTELRAIKDYAKRCIAAQNKSIADELASLRQYKAEAESQKPIGTCRLWNAGGSGEFRELWGIDDLADGQQVYARPVPAGSCAVPEWQPIEAAPKDGTRVLLYTSLGIIEGYWPTGIKYDGWFQDVVEEDSLAGCTITYEPTHWMAKPDTSMLSTIPSNSEGEKS